MLSHVVMSEDILSYFNILVFLFVGLLFGFGPILAGFLLGPRRYNAEKSSVYECGFEPFGDARSPFDVRFYLVALLFIIFDLEVVFLFPWAVCADILSLEAFYAVFIFLLLLVIGFVYEWNRGALEWE